MSSMRLSKHSVFFATSGCWESDLMIFERKLSHGTDHRNFLVRIMASAHRPQGSPTISRNQPFYS